MALKPLVNSGKRNVTESEREIGIEIGTYLFEKRELRGFNKRTISDYLFNHWGITHSTATQYIRSLELGGRLAHDIVNNSNTTLQRISDYCVALNLPISPRSKISNLIKKIEREAKIPDSKVCPY